jgi:hypothetical protein
MPKVGMKNFSYDQSGVEKAQAEADKTGLPIEYEDRHYAQYNEGGRVYLQKQVDKMKNKVSK